MLKRSSISVIFISIYSLSMGISGASGRDLFVCGEETPCSQGRAKTAVVGKIPSKGRIKALAIFVKFAGEFPNTTSPPSYSKDIFDIDLPGSFSHFYREMSCGLLEVDGEILPRLYVSDHPASYYIDRYNCKENEWSPYGQVVSEILEKVDPDVDFSNFDNDGPDEIPDSGDDDGYVDVVFVNFLRVPSGFIIGEALGMANLGISSNGFVSSDRSASGDRIGVRVGAVQESASFPRLVGAMCHEFGHLLGLGDLYYQGERNPPDKESAGIGCWGLMGHGAWGWNGNDGPNPFCAYSLEKLGWIGVDNERLEVVTQSQNISFLPLFQGGNVYRIPLSNNEYYLICSKDRSASYYDRYIPGNGLLIWHITGGKVDLECADGRYGDAGYPLGKKVDPASGEDNLDFWAHDESYRTCHCGNLGDSTDLFDGERFTSFSESTNPSSRWEGCGIRPHVDWKMVVSNIAINEIHRESKTMSAAVTVPQGVELFGYAIELYETGKGWVSVGDSASPGDRFRLKFWVKSWLDRAFDSLSVTLSTDDPFVNPKDGFQSVSFTFKPLLPGDINRSAPKEFIVAFNAPPGHEIAFHISAGSGGFEWKDSIAIHVVGVDWMVLRTDNSGLSSDRVNALEIDQRGDVWIGSNSGLTKFDGTDCTVYRMNDSGLPSNWITGLTADNEGNMWVGTRGSGLAKFDGTEWTVYNVGNSGLPSNRINTLAADGEGNIWVGSANGLARFDGDNWKAYNRGNSGLLSNRIYAVAFDREGYIWIGSDSGLAKFDGTDWRVYDTSNSELPNNNVNALALDGQGHIWIGTHLGGLARFDGNNWAVYREYNSGLPSNTVNALATDGEGNMWVGSNDGLGKFDGTNWTVYRTDNSGLPDNDITDLITDGKENIWIGTYSGGLAVYREGGVILPRFTSVEEDYDTKLPLAFSLSQNYPNPFNATTGISFSIPKRSHVKIAIHNVLGQLVRELTGGTYAPGIHHVRWDGKDSSSVPVSSGIYFYSLTTDNGAGKITKKMILLR